MLKIRVNKFSLFCLSNTFANNLDIYFNYLVEIFSLFSWACNHKLYFSLLFISSKTLSKTLLSSIYHPYPLYILISSFEMFRILKLFLVFFQLVFWIYIIILSFPLSTLFSWDGGVWTTKGWRIFLRFFTTSPPNRHFNIAHSLIVSSSVCFHLFLQNTFYWFTIQNSKKA